MRNHLRLSITVQGHVTDRLAAGFDGLTPVRRPGSTDLVGEVADQAAVHSLLARVRDLGLILEAVTVVNARHDPAGTPTER